MIILQQFNDYLGVAVQSNEKSPMSQKAQQMTESQLSDYVNNCNMIFNIFQSTSSESQILQDLKVLSE